MDTFGFAKAYAMQIINTWLQGIMKRRQIGGLGVIASQDYQRHLTLGHSYYGEVHPQSSISHTVTSTATMLVDTAPVHPSEPLFTVQQSVG